MTSAPSQSEAPRVSVICRSVGRELLADALASVSRQTHSNIELLLVDAKGDKLAAYQQLIDKAGGKIVSEAKPLPRAQAANLGLDAATGDYLLFLDDDDWIDPEHIASLLESLEKHPGAVGAYSDVRKTSVDGKPGSVVFSQAFDRVLLLRDNYIPIHAMLFRRSLLDDGCRFDEQFDIFEDWDFWLQAVQHGDFVHRPVVTAYYRAGGDSHTASDQAKDRYAGDNPMARGRSKLFDKWLGQLDGQQFNAMLGSMDRSDELAELGNTVGSLNESLQQQADLVQSQQQQAIELHAQLGSANQRAEEISGKLARAEAQLAQTRASLQEASIRRAALEHEVNKQRHTLNVLRGHIALLEDTLNAIYASKGWRLMGPARRLMRLIRRLLGSNATAAKLPESDPASAGSTVSDPDTDKQPATIHCAFDLVAHCEDRLYLRGWASANGALDKIELVTESGDRIEVVRDQFRIDITEAFPDHADADRAGFCAFVESDSKHASLEFFASGELIKTVDLEAESVAGFADYSARGEFVYLDLQTQYDIYRWQEQRDDRKRDSLLPLLVNKPLISIIVPVFNVEPAWLDACVQSVLNQTYGNWQLCLHDDKSTNQHTLDCLGKWADHDERIRVQYGEQNQHISGASNSALELAEGEFIGLMDNDDELHPLALEYVAHAIDQNPDGDYFYTDEDKLDEQGCYCQPHFKPDYSPTLLESMMYVGHFGVIRRSCIDRVGGFRAGYEGSQDFDLTLRIAEITDRFIHIPRVLYHWRIIPGSVAGETGAKSYAYDAAVKALQDHVEKQSPRSEVSTTEFPGLYQIKRIGSESARPSVAIIMPFHNKPQMTIDCLESVFASSYAELDILVVSNNSEPGAIEQVAAFIEKDDRARLLTHDVPFNWSAINNFAATKTDADYLLFLNNDMQVIDRDWIERLLDVGIKPEVGATGGRLLYEDGTVQHAGLVIGLGGIAGHAFKYMADESPGYFGYAAVAREVSAVTGACMLVRREAFTAVSGFDESLAVAYNDVDFCLRLKAAGFSSAYTPFASLYHFESKTRPRTPEDMSAAERVQFDEESQRMRERHSHYFETGDPLYNPSLTLLLENYSLRIDPR